jgi:hypothetical protein
MKPTDTLKTKFGIVEFAALLKSSSNIKQVQRPPLLLNIMAFNGQVARPFCSKSVILGLVVLLA